MPRGGTRNDENVAQTSCLLLARLQAGSLRYLIFVVIFFKFKIIAGNKKPCPAAGQGFFRNDIQFPSYF